MRHRSRADSPWARPIAAVGVVTILAVLALLMIVDARGGETGQDPSAEASPSTASSASPDASAPSGLDQSPSPAASSGVAGVQPTPGPRHVVVISVDGLGSELIESAAPAELPTLTFLRAEGSGTLNARTEVEQTVTLPNHAGMLTGRPIDPDSGGHGVVVNADRGGTVQQLAGAPVESVFDVVNNAGGTTALFATEEKFALFDRSWPDSIDHFVAEQDADEAVMDLAIDDLLTQRRVLTFIHLGLVDEVGHASGWLSPEQREAASTADSLIGDLVEAIQADRPLSRRLVLIVTADHGGVGRAHGGADDPRNFTVPLLAWGAGVARGADLYALNPRLADPGDAQTGYDEATPIRNGCVADITTAVLGLPPVDGSSLCRDGLVLASD